MFLLHDKQNIEYGVNLNTRKEEKKEKIYKAKQNEGKSEIRVNVKDNERNDKKKCMNKQRIN